MKIRIIFTFVLLFAGVFFYFSKPNAKENNISVISSGFKGDTIFRIGAYWDAMAMFNYDTLKELGFNLWQFTGAVDDGWVRAGISNDYRNTHFNFYGENVKKRIQRNFDEGNLKSIMDRSKINYLGLGKRSDYVCRATNINSNYWFYAYREHDNAVSDEFLDNSQFGGSNLWVRYSSVSNKSRGYVVKGLIANREQLNYPSGQDYKWYIMPRIRIKPQDTSSNKLVCRIEILRFDSNLVKSINIKSFNFKDAAHPYKGGYLEKFYGLSELLELDSTGVFNPYPHHGYDNENCKVDIRVYWYGLCDMWIDRIRVENEIAYNLFGDNPDSTLYQIYNNQWLPWEATEIAYQNAGKAHYFIIDEPEFATLPVLGYLNKKIDSLSYHTNGVVPVFARDNLRVVMPDYTNVNFEVSQLKTYLMDSAGFKMFSFDCYPLYGWNDWFSPGPTLLPNTLHRTMNYNADSGYLGQPVNITQYENWLQNYFDDTTQFDGGDRYIKTLKYGYELYKKYNLPFSASLQGFMWYDKGTRGGYREPTNEELALMTNLAAGYGAKEIMYFVYSSYGSIPASKENPVYWRGFTDDGNLVRKREINAYGQNKWEGIKSVTTRLTKWGPYLMKFANTKINSYVYRNPEERNQMKGNTFIKQVKAYIPAAGISDTSTVTRNLPFNQQNETYIQVSVFDLYNSVPNEKYFMIINRRCSPCVNNTSADKIGGRRIITIDLSGLPDIGNWKIYNLEDNKSVGTFNKSELEINLGNFLPGEGKLFKIVPA